MRKSDLVYNPTNSVNSNTNTLKQYLINSIPLIFEKIVERNSVKNRNIASKFDLKAKLNINLQDYIFRLLKTTYAEVSTVIYALILIDKLCSTKKFFLTEKNMHKTFLAALILAIKINEDVIFEEGQYTFASGLSAKELALLEFEFMTLLDYNLKIQDEEFHLYLSNCVEASSIC